MRSLIRTLGRSLDLQVWQKAQKHMVRVVDVTGDHEPVSIVLQNGLSGVIHIICEEFCEFGTLRQFRQGRALDEKVWENRPLP